MLQLLKLGVKDSQRLFVSLDLDVFLFNLLHNTLDRVLNQLTDFVHLYEFMLAEVHGGNHQVSIQTFVITFASELDVRLELIFFIFRNVVITLLPGWQATTTCSGVQVTNNIKF